MVPRAIDAVGLRSRCLIIASLSIPQCVKYRIIQKKELLESLGWSVTLLDWQASHDAPTLLATHKCIIFYRVMGTPEMLSLMDAAKQLKIQCFWEIDDLLFGSEADGSRYAPNEEGRQKNQVMRLLFESAMKKCVSAITSTPRLALHMEEAGVKAFLLENALDSDTTAIAEKLTTHHSSGEQQKNIRMVYGSGWSTHSEDFELIAPAIASAMEQVPELSLRIIGYLKIPESLQAFSSRIEFRKFRPFEAYMQLVSECDINLAPLKISEFSRCKSNIKFLEAAALKIPTIASPIDAYASIIEHNQNGLLANSIDEWQQAILMLASDSQLRDRMGAAAYIAAENTRSIALKQAQEIFGIASQSNASNKNILIIDADFDADSAKADKLNELAHHYGWNVFILTTIAQYKISPLKLTRLQSDHLTIFALGVSEDDLMSPINPEAEKGFQEILKTITPNLVHAASLKGLGLNLLKMLSLHDITTISSLDKTSFTRDAFIEKCLESVCEVEIDIASSDVDKIDSIYTQTLQSHSTMSDLLQSASRFRNDKFDQNLFTPYQVGFTLHQMAKHYQSAKEELFQRHKDKPQEQLVSIIMPTYNRKNIIGRAISSVVQQHYTNWELVIVDDGGQDDTGSLVESFRNPKIHYSKLSENQGPAAARNTAIEKASGSLICYLDTDNFMEPEFLTILVNELVENADCDIVYCAQSIERKQQLQSAVRYAPFHRPLLENNNYIDLNALLHKKERLPSEPAFNEAMGGLEDWEMLLRLTEQKAAHGIPAILSRYYVGNRHTSRNLGHDKLEALKHIDAYLQTASSDKMLFDLHHRPSPTSKVNVAIIVTHSGKWSNLLHCIKSITSTTRDNCYELIIIDSNEQLSGDKLSKHFPDQRLKLLKRYNEITISEDIGGIALLQSDVITTTGWLNALLSVCEEHEDCGIAIPRLTQLGDKTAKQDSSVIDATREHDIALLRQKDEVLRVNYNPTQGYVLLSHTSLHCAYIPRNSYEKLNIFTFLNNYHSRVGWAYSEALRELYEQIVLYTPHSKLYLQQEPIKAEG